MMEAALNNAQQPGFNEQEERRTRTKMVTARYKRKLAAKRNRSYRSIAPARLKKNEEVEEKVDPEVYSRENKIRPIGDKEFMQLVKDRGIRWTKKNKPYNCPIHANGPLLELKKTKCVAAIDVIDEALVELARIKGLSSQQREEKANLMTGRAVQKNKLRKLDKKITKYKEHLRQYEVCRKALDDLAANLKPGQCITYRDFVNQYTSDGKKMGNLQLVVLYRLIPGTCLLQLKVYNFSGGKRGVRCDPYYVADVFDFHMKPKSAGGSGLFEKFNKIYVSGDHGSHFSATRTIFNESRMELKYGKHVHVLSLCSYHCYNLCDSAGVIGKDLAAKAALEGLELTTSDEYARAVI
jgi:hypothetical protein